MYEKLKFDSRYTEMTNSKTKHTDMLMDIGIYTLTDEKLDLYDETQETAILLLEGDITFIWDGMQKMFSRPNVFDYLPACLHVPAKTKVEIKASGRTEVLVQKTVNSQKFEAKLYMPEDCSDVYAGKGVLNNTSQRVIRTIFDSVNAPYSNMVIGEVISMPGNWSSFPPHIHDQPEVYYYKFDKPQGFGCAIVGQDAYYIEDNSYITIPGGLQHPQATAPGYAMYFCWMIRHLEDNPWNKRIFLKEHEWLNEENPKIWTPQK